MIDLSWTPYGLPLPEMEFKFHPTRKWRFDFAWPEWKIAVEIEGAVWTQGRHTRGSGFIKDMEKYSYANIMGWCVIRGTPQQLQDGTLQKLVGLAFAMRNYPVPSVMAQEIEKQVVVLNAKPHIGENCVGEIQKRRGVIRENGEKGIQKK